MHWSTDGTRVTDPALEQLDAIEDRWRGLKTAPVSKSDDGWQSFREKTRNGKRKRPAILFRSNRPSRYSRVRP